MDMLLNNAYAQIQDALERIVLGKPCDPLDIETDSSELNQIIELLNILISNLGELGVFSRELSKGNVSVVPPGRRNYLAAPLKELQSQLSGFVWRVNQLQNGHITERLDYMGELAVAFNLLLDKIIRSPLQDGGSPEEQQVALNSWRYHQITMAFHHLHLMVLGVDKDGHIAFANHPATSLFKELSCLRPDLAEPETRELVEALAAASTDANTFPAYNELYASKAGAWYKIISDQILFPNNQLLYMHTIDDISEWKICEQKLQISASIDPLTGAFNRVAGLNALSAALNKNSDPGGSCVAFIDIDKLKAINDSYGHNEGDYAIQKIAHVLMASVRDADNVIRFGGDEFLVIFRQCSMDAAERIIARMYEKLEYVNRTNTKPFKLAFSYGLVQITAGSKPPTVKEIIQLADKKMYESKNLKKAAEAFTLNPEQTHPSA